MNDVPLFLTFKEFGERSGIPDRVVDEMVESRAIRIMWLGRRKMIPRTELDRLEESMVLSTDGIYRLAGLHGGEHDDDASA